jgi:3-oxoacyl-[acyl-carrier-protein] synthase III
MSLNSLSYNNAKIEGIVTVTGDKKVDFMSSFSDYNLTELDAKRLSKVMGLSSRYVVSGEQTTSDLCFEASKKLLEGVNISPKEIGGLIFVSQSPDFSCPATAISLQHRLGMNISSLCFDIRLGCSGFVYGLASAYGFIEAGADNIILCVGDVASKLVEPSEHAIAPIMGDAGSAILIQRKKSKSIFNLYSDGSGYDALIIPNSGIRKEPQFKGVDPFMKMDGSKVFDFTLKRVPSLINNIIDESEIPKESIDYFVLHQPNKYMLQNIKKRLKIDDNKIPHSTQSIYGNQNSASITGTINGFLGDKYSSESLITLIAGFGIGLSWGAAIIETDNIFAPKSFKIGD